MKVDDDQAAALSDCPTMRVCARGGHEALTPSAYVSEIDGATAVHIDTTAGAGRLRVTINDGTVYGDSSHSAYPQDAYGADLVVPRLDDGLAGAAVF